MVEERISLEVNSLEFLFVLDFLSAVPVKLHNFMVYWGTSL